MIAIGGAYLAQTGRDSLLMGLRWEIGVAVVLCVLLEGLAQGPSQSQARFSP